MTQLLVSVRSAAEAEIALVGGAGLIDIKEPSRGSLGRADDDTIAEVMRSVAGRKPVSAALGELADCPSPPAVHGLRFVKWGLAGCAERDWQKELQQVNGELDSGCDPVAVAYADWQRAAAPRPSEVAAFASEHGWPVLLLDTWCKDRTTLFDWLPSSVVAKMREQCWATGIRVALAGSLGFNHLDMLRQLQPDWLAVRGAVCRNRDRTATLDAKRIARLAHALADHAITPASAAG